MNKPREFWVYEQKNTEKRTPYPTCYRSEPQWGCAPLPADDLNNEVIHVREVVPLSDEGKKHIKALVRRRGHLRTRIKENLKGVDLIHDKREEAALSWAIEILGDRPLAREAQDEGEG